MNLRSYFKSLVLLSALSFSLTACMSYSTPEGILERAYRVIKTNDAENECVIVFHGSEITKRCSSKELTRLKQKIESFDAVVLGEPEQILKKKSGQNIITQYSTPIYGKSRKTRNWAPVFVAKINCAQYKNDVMWGNAHICAIFDLQEK